MLKGIARSLRGLTIAAWWRTGIQRRRLRAVIRAASPLRIVLGAGGTSWHQWISTDSDLLDITSAEDWAALLTRGSVDRMLAEHVLEHLSADKTRCALSQCWQYLRVGGRIRIAVPDGYRPDPPYLAAVAPPVDGHKILYTVDTLVPLLENLGFAVTPLEFFDVSGRFNSVQWDAADGMVMRSRTYDHQTEFRFGSFFYTSLIVDAEKA